jgi:DNA-directed RNA polymerase specialized sigma subunit
MMSDTEPVTPNEEAALRELEAMLTDRGRVLSHREIARRLGISHGGSQLIEARAIAKLRDMIRKRGAEW